ncbi:MAG: phosphatidylethanolamine-binding protein [Omnitrophica bacterium RBG_13_46_9]|nr:MAG: phosphatidylethanolamine-binding protein [Omnitrophica bacterium RBG_13_46_9]
MALELKSPAFKNGEFIPARYAGTGEDLSPPLEWSDVPEGTKSFALISDDPDAPVGTWVHWVLYDIPADKKNLPEGIRKDKILADGAKQGMTDFRRIGYGGPYPPPGPAHRYYFKLYALDTKLNLEPGLSKEELERAMQGHIVGKAELVGKFKR